MLLRVLIKSIAMPPMGQILLIVFGLVLRKWRPRLGNTAIALGLISLYLLSTPFVSNGLHAGLETIEHIPPEKIESLDAQAIVILSGWQNDFTPEFGEPVSGVESLSRMRYGAFLHDNTGLPVLVTGGSVHGDNKRSLAATMAFDLEMGFKVSPRWLEERSRTTYENAKFSREILAQEGINKILLVSSAYHLKRASILFKREGFDVIPAPTFFISKAPTNSRSLIPSVMALEVSGKALHEWIGIIYYQIVG